MKGCVLQRRTWDPSTLELLPPYKMAAGRLSLALLTQHAGPLFGDCLSSLVHVALFLTPHYTHSLPCTSDTTDNTELPISHVCFLCSYLLCAINLVKHERNSVVSPSLVGTLNGFMARESPINHFYNIPGGT